MVRSGAVRGAVALLVGIALFAGGQPQTVSAAVSGGKYFDLDQLPGVETTGKAIADSLDKLATDHPLRVTGSPNELKVADLLKTEMAGLGYTTEIKGLPLHASAAPTAAAGALKAVTAAKRGTTNPDEYVLFIGHYDNVPQTIYGTYDNGSGTNMLRFLARELAEVKTNRSIMFAWYNGEEEGALASEQHAKALKAANTKIAAVFGFDMVGIGYPNGTTNPNNCMCLFHGAADGSWAAPMMKHVNHEFLGFPSGKTQVSVVGTNTRNSDERSFAAQGYRTMRWAGLRTAGAYTGYHLPDDTMATIDTMSGGHSFFEQGSENTLRSAYYTALAVDNAPPVPAMTASVDGATARFDGTGSTDADGPLSGFRWDFGDGTTGQGATASHTYAAPGTYTATLYVADNLHSTVERAATVTVTVG